MTALVARQILRTNASNSPHLFIDATTIDFGLVRSDDFSQSSLELSNRGSATLIISEISASCSCSVASIEKSTLQPSEATKLHIRVKGSTNPTSSADIFLRSNDTKNPLERIKLFFHSRTGIWVEPETLSFGHFELGKSIDSLPVRECAIQSDHRIRIDELEIQCDECFKLAFSHAVHQRKDGDFRISVSPQSNAPCGIVSGQLFVSDQGGNVVTLKVEAYFACGDRIAFIKPVLMRKSSFGGFTGEGAIRLIKGSKASVVSSNLIGLSDMEISSVFLHDEILVSCKSTTVHEGQMRFTAEVLLEDDSSLRTKVWVPIVVENDLVDDFPSRGLLSR